MSVPFIDFKEQNRLIKDEVDVGFKKVFEKGDYILGEQAKLFEESFAKFCEVQYGVGVNSGTDALHLALIALDIFAGLIQPPNRKLRPWNPFPVRDLS